MNAPLREQLLDSLDLVKVEQAVEALHSAVRDLSELQRAPSTEQFFWDELSNLHHGYTQLGFIILNASKRAA